MKTKKILIGISSGISIYKICTLVRKFVKEGQEVKIIMTENATQMISPLTFKALSHSLVYVKMFDLESKNTALLHLELANWPDVFILAPATANTIGKIANGICDNLLTTTIIALPQKIPLVIVPAMNVNMWENPFVQENIKKLKKRSNCYILEPKYGILAEGIKGKGRMPEPEEIFSFVKKILKKK